MRMSGRSSRPTGLRSWSLRLFDLWTLGFSILQRENEKIVGVCGFKGPPGADGIVEIAYGLFQNFGTGLRDRSSCSAHRYNILRRSRSCCAAHTLSQTNASARVLTKCGFEAIGEVHDPEDGWVWRWEQVNCPAVERNGIKYLPALEIPGHQSSGSGTADHPMRIATRRAAGLDERGWTSELRDEVETFFDELAPEWHTRISPERAAIVADALERGLGAAEQGMAVEVGSGIGAYSGLLAKRFAPVVAADLSMSMLKLAPQNRRIGCGLTARGCRFATDRLRQSC